MSIQFPFAVLITAIFLLSNCSKKPNQPPVAGDEITIDTMVAGMAPLPSDTFAMGSVTDELIRSVFVTKFLIDTVEVTQAEYREVTGKNPSYFSIDSLKPIESVTWFDAVLFCNARSKRDGLDSVYAYKSITGTAFDGCSAIESLVVSFDKNGYRLPTEAEWEYACRGGTTSIFYWGNGLSTRADTASADSNSVWFNNSYRFGSGNVLYGSRRVASKKANPFGLYDMSGNVLEWCYDFYAPYTSGFQSNPTGPASGATKVIRGGSWGSGGDNLRSSSRQSMAPDSKSQFVGFRCARRLR